MWSFAFTLTFVMEFMLKGTLVQEGEICMLAKIDKKSLASDLKPNLNLHDHKAVKEREKNNLRECALRKANKF